jgi:hypothetical protein
MKSSNALSRIRTVEQDNEQTLVAPLPQDAAQKIALSWMDTATMEDALSDMGRGVITWRAVPPVQNAFAAIASEMIAQDTKIFCSGFQAYGWMLAAGQSMTDVMRTYIGKIHAQNVVSMSAEDICTQIKKGPMNIVALHVEDGNGWNDVRAISAAAVKSEAHMLMLVSAAIPAPEGVMLDVIKNWNQGASIVREAFISVRDKAAIRVVAMDDMTPSQMEDAMMTSLDMTVDAWTQAGQKNNDGAEFAANAAYQSPVETF